MQLGDLIIIVLILLNGIEGFFDGGVAALVGMVVFIFSFLFGLRSYGWFADIVLRYVSLPAGIGKAVGFFIAVSVGEMLLRLILKRPFSYLHYKINDRFYRLNQLAGFIFGCISGVFFVMVLVSIVATVPVSPKLKQTITSSTLGNFLLSQNQIIEKNLHGVLDEATSETMNFLTVKPESNASVPLRFKASGSVDIDSETAMLASVNTERVNRGLKPLVIDRALQQVARAHAKDMLERGYFSHYTPKGLSPFDRMTNAGITYQYAGENLAFSPDVLIAMQGLMNSKGHRENILEPHFGKAGIGVLDAGIYGKMFVQEFRD